MTNSTAIGGCSGMGRAVSVLPCEVKDKCLLYPVGLVTAVTVSLLFLHFCQQ